MELQQSGKNNESSSSSMLFSNLILNENECRLGGLVKVLCRLYFISFTVTQGVKYDRLAAWYSIMYCAVENKYLLFPNLVVFFICLLCAISFLLRSITCQALLQGTVQQGSTFSDHPPVDSHSLKSHHHHYWQFPHQLKVNQDFREYQALQFYKL